MARSLQLVTEVTFWVVGLALIALYFGTVAHGEIERRDGIAAFTGAYSAPDQSTWSQGRIDAYKASVTSGSMPVGVLRIARVNLEVPVYVEATERNLNRGAGLIAGTALPGSDGNIGVAAHRDGYFRTLRYVAIGDVIELDSPHDRSVYVVSELSIVEPTDIRPLNETDTPAITLVTCYPFHFAGSAPKRYIVRAVLQPGTGATQ
jgi:sortase A